MKNAIRTAAFAMASAAVLSGGTLASAPASEASNARNGICQDLEFCLYPQKNQQGSASDFTASVSNYGTASDSTCYKFIGPGASQNKCIKNQAESFHNRTRETVVVYYYNNFDGAKHTIPPGHKSNLNSQVSSENASHTIGDHQKIAYWYFRNNGYTAKQSAGIVGNLIQESGRKLDPGAAQASGPGRGIAQWEKGGRWDTNKNDNLLSYAKQQGMTPYSLSLQLKFIKYELDTFSGYGKATLKQSTTISGADESLRETLREVRDLLLGSSS